MEPGIIQQMTQGKFMSDIPQKDIQAMIKFALFILHMKIEDNRWYGIPLWFPIKLCNDDLLICDSLFGPCSCGDWHYKKDERSIYVSRKNRISSV